jgi:glycosyltransferase involved in cell wall biosynthesis
MILSIKKYNFIVVTNENEKKWIKSHIRENNILKISNGIEKKKYEILSSLNLYQNKKFSVTYIGNIGIAQNLKILVECAKELSEIDFNIIGKGAEYDELKNYAKTNDIGNINFLGKKSWDEILYFYENSSVLYAQLDEKFKTAMPSKLYEYASTGLPVIYGGVGTAVGFVKNLENAKAVRPNNKDELKEAILFFKAKERFCSDKNQDFIRKNYIREEEAKKIIKIAELMINEGRKI